MYLGADFKVVDVETGRVCDSTRIWRRDEALSHLQISDRTMSRYIRLLTDVFGGGFKYRARTRTLTGKQVKAIARVNDLLKGGLLYDQIKTTLIKEGLPR